MKQLVLSSGAYEVRAGFSKKEFRLQAALLEQNIRPKDAGNSLLVQALSQVGTWCFICLYQNGVRAFESGYDALRRLPFSDLLRAATRMAENGGGV